MKKWLLYGVGAIAIVVVALFALDYFADVPILRSVPVAQDAVCSKPVNVQGSSMEPAISEGERVVFDKCIDDVDALTVGTVVLVNDGGMRIGRIQEVQREGDRTMYVIGRDNRPEDDVFTVEAEKIVGVWEE